MSAVEKAEESLRQSKGILRALFEFTPDAMVVIDPSGTIVLANSQAERIFGYERDELLGQREEVLMPTHFHTHHTGYRDDYFVARHTRPMGVGRELWGKRKDGSEFPVEISLSQMETEQGPLVFSSIRDITNQKQIEAELRLNQHSLQAALDVANLATWGWDEASQTKLWTSRTKAIFGLASEGEVTPALFRSLLHPDDLPLYEEAWAAATDPDGSHTYYLEYRIRRASDGAERWIRSKAAVEFEDGKLIQVIGALHDITEERLAEVTLRESEERYHSLFNLMDEGYCIIEVIFDDNQKGVDWLYLEVNEAFEKQTGFTGAQGKRIREFIPNDEDSVSEISEIYGRVSLTGEPVRFANQVKAMEGSWFDIYAFRVGGATSRKIAVLFTNITSQKSTEDRIRVSEVRYRRLFEAAKDGVLLLDPETRKITDANPFMTTLLGYTHEALVGKELFEIGLLKDELASQEMFEKLTDNLQVRYDDLPLESQDGKRQEVEVVANLYDEGGHAVIQCNIRDITERKRAEKALHASEELFRVLAESVPQFVWISNTEGMLEYVNPQWTEYTGLSLAQTIANQDESMYHSDDIYHMYQAWKEALQSGASYSVEVRIRRAQDGIFRWFLIRGIPQYDTAGTVIHWFCVTTDIEDQKQAQARTVDRNTLLQRAVAESHHRIKNNLQVLSALVELQVPLQGDTVPVSELKRIGQHIRTLAALHDLLTIDSKTGVDLDTISLKAALEKLVPILQATSGGRKIQVQADEMVITLKQGGSFTLLVNELISNALKHGKGDVHVTLTLLPGHTAQLEVCDDGPGFPPGFDPLKSANTGIELIESMGRWDLCGEILYQNRPTGGACVIITFPLAAEQSSAGAV